MRSPPVGQPTRVNVLSPVTLNAAGVRAQLLESSEPVLHHVRTATFKLLRSASAASKGGRFTYLALRAMRHRSVRGLAFQRKAVTGVNQVTVLEAIQKSTDFLAKKGVDSPRLQSELLLAHILQTQRLKLYMDFARGLDDAHTDALRELVKRRGGREPLQHILGSTSFCGLEMAVNYNVLIPRPETELLAEEGWKFLNSLQRASTFLDFGTGSGCIAISLCHFAPGAKGWALDKSSDALQVARENAGKNKVTERLSFLPSDGFSAVDSANRFDLIISNPPYIPLAEIATLQEEVRKFDPHAALDGGSDGLDFYRMLAAEAPRFLASGGKLLVEFGDGQASAISEILTGAGWQVEVVMNDYTARPRMIWARRA